MGKVQINYDVYNKIVKFCTLTCMIREPTYIKKIEQ